MEVGHGRAAGGGQEDLAPRAERLRRLAETRHDVVVVGGGITGAGIALDLALRGVRTLLVERGDWAGATSSASSRLVHGGLRYLEQLELALVRDSCLERALLLRNAAGLVWPETFLFPVRRGDRVGRLRLGAGLALYTLLSVPRVLGVPGLCSRRTASRRVPGIDGRSLRGGGHYLDAATDDARLALAVVRSAARAGATVLSRVELAALESGASGVALRLRDAHAGGLEVRARAAVLAGGPFTEELRRRAGLSGAWISPTRGSHVVVPRERLPTDGAVIFPSAVDGRVMFLIPWPRYTVIGTTDVDADPAQPVRATRAEVRYLLDSANALVPFAELGEEDVVSTWAGLRPLLAAPESDPSARSREERVVREGPVWTIAGGKLTGYRSMAEELCARLCDELGLGARGRRSPTRSHRLVGALDEPPGRPGWSRLEDGAVAARKPLIDAWSKRYAALAADVRRACGRAPEGERALDAETLLGEVDWAVAREDCRTASDFVLRRTDLGYGPLSALRAALPSVESRLARLLGWTHEEGERSRAELEADLDRMHGWRERG